MNSQNDIYKSFLIDFKNDINSEFTEIDLKKLCNKYASLMLFGGESNGAQFTGAKPIVFPLAQLKKEPFYRQNIVGLLQSTNANLRMLGYLTAAAAGDDAFNHRLLEALHSDPSAEGRKYACGALLRLRDSHTTELFNYLVENKDCAPLQSLYLYLDKKSLLHTAYKEITSVRDESKILAVQSLMVTDLNPRTEAIVKRAIKNWTPTMKVYAIDTARFLKIGHLKEFLAPYVDEPSLRKSCLSALAASPSKADQEYLSIFIPPDSEIPSDVLNAYLKSPYEFVVRKWLVLVRDRQVNEKYSFSVFSQPLLLSDSMLEAVRNTISKTNNQGVKAELTRGLAARNGSATTH